MSALLAGARFLLRHGQRVFPAYVAWPVAVPVRCLSVSFRLQTLVAQDQGSIDLDHLLLRDGVKPQLHSYSLRSKLNSKKPISKEWFLTAFEDTCSAGKLSSNQAGTFLQACGSMMPEVSLSERNELTDTVWRKLQELGVDMTEKQYNTLLSIYIQNEHKFSPTEFLAEMEAAQLQPNRATYEMLIAAYCAEGDIPGASQILGFMKSNNIPITEVVFSSLITGHARSGDMESAENILPIMQGAGLTPGRGAYTALLCAYAEKGDIEAIKQTLEKSTHQTAQMLLKTIYSLSKSGHAQFVPDILEHLQKCPEDTQAMRNICLTLLAQGYGDISIQIARQLCNRYPDCDFSNQPGSFFLHQCVRLDMPVDTIKQYGRELEDSGLLRSPLEFALLCALELGKKDMSLNLIRVLKEEGLPVKPHYCWPLLASSVSGKNAQETFQLLKEIHEIGVELDLATFQNYLVELFKDVKSAASLLEENSFSEAFHQLYSLALREGLLTHNLAAVNQLLSSGIPFVLDKSLMNAAVWAFQRNKDVEHMAKMTNLLYLNVRTSENLPKESAELVGLFLYKLFDGMSESEVQNKEEYLKQYLYKLKTMEVIITKKYSILILLSLKSYGVPRLIEAVKSLECLDLKDKPIHLLEETLKQTIADNRPVTQLLKNIIDVLIEKQDLEKILELKATYRKHFTFGMYMKVLGYLCNINNVEEALNLREEVKQRGFTDTASAMKYMSLLKLLTVNGHIDDAINVLEEMQKRNVDAPNKSYFHILNHLAINGDVDAVNRLHGHIVTLGLAEPTSNLCSPLVVAHLNRKEISDALDASIACYRKYKCCTMEYQLLLAMVEMGETALLKKAVDHVSDAIGERLMLLDLLFVFIELGKYEEAWKIAETPGLRGNPKKLEWIFYKFRRHNQVEAWAKGLEITRGLYGCDREEMYFKLLLLYEDSKDWKKAAELWYKIQEEGITLQTKTMVLFKNIFEANGENIFDHIPEFSEEAIQRVTQGQADTEVSLKIIELCKDKKVDEAYSLFKESAQEKIVFTKSVCTRLIAVLLECGQLENALKVEEITKSYYRDYSMKNIFWHLLLEEQVRRDCLKDAVITLEKMLQKGSVPMSKTMKALTSAFATKGDVGSLENLKAMTSSSSVSLPWIEKLFFDTKLLAHFVNGNFEEATSMIEHHCIKHHNTSLSYLIKRLVKCNIPEALEKVSIVTERLCNQFSIYYPVTDLFLQYVYMNQMEEATHLLQRCSAISNQTAYLKQHITENIYKHKFEYVQRLLDVLSDPYYKQIGYNNLIFQYSKMADKLDAALDVLKKMKEEDIHVEDRSLRRLANTLRGQNRPVPFPEPQGSALSVDEEGDSPNLSDDED